MVLTLIRATKGNSYFALWSLQWTITIARYVLVYLLHLMNLDMNRTSSHMNLYWVFLLFKTTQQEKKSTQQNKKIPNKYGMSVHPIVPHTQHRYCRALGQG